MAQILNDKEIEKLLGSVIVDGSPDCIHPNSYIIRLGTDGEFLNTGKEFNLGKKKKGIVIQPGHSVALTSFEVVDFSRDTVRKIYPNHDLHGILSPTTDLSREGIVAPTTQIDAGYKGTLNWTIANTSSNERKYLYKENIFRLMIFKLGESETPADVYHGDYQDKTGYVRSARKGAPVGMKDSEWENSKIEGGPEEALENLIKSGYPWNMLGKKLAAIDGRLQEVTTEYETINESIRNVKDEMREMRTNQDGIPSVINKLLKDNIQNYQYRWMVGVGSLISLLIGICLAVLSNETAKIILKNYGLVIGLLIMVISIGVLAYFFSKNKNNSH